MDIFIYALQAVFILALCPRDLSGVVEPLKVVPAQTLLSSIAENKVTAPMTGVGTVVFALDDIKFSSYASLPSFP